MKIQFGSEKLEVLAQNILLHFIKTLGNSEITYINVMSVEVEEDKTNTLMQTTKVTFRDYNNVKFLFESHHAKTLACTNTTVKAIKE